MMFTKVLTLDRIAFYFAIFAISYYLQNYTQYYVSTNATLTSTVEWFKQDTLHYILGLLFIILVIELTFSFLGILFFPANKSKRTQKKSRTAKQAELQSRAKSFPPPYPNGWYRILNSEELKKGEVKHVHIVGTHFAVFRGEDGKPAILDAFCPHLGANLGVGGKVVKNEVECPFHGWRFNKEGQCTSIPYAECVPAVAKTESWPVFEYANMICVYFDAKKRKPSYYPDPLPEIDSGKFVYKGEWSMEVDMHIQDFSENSADFAHFDYLHARTAIPFFKSFIFIRHKLDWKEGAKEDNKGCFSYFYDNATLYTTLLPSVPLPRIVNAEITFNGPAGIVYFRFKTILGDIVLIKTFQPIAPLTQIVQDRYYANPLLPSFLVKFICKEAVNAFTDDIFVWANKSYSFKPILIKEDGPVKGVRRWYNQFYCDESISMVDALNINSNMNSKDAKIDW